MMVYYASVEDFKKFMRFFRLGYPELYAKYKSYILMPVSGIPGVHINADKPLTPVARYVLKHIIAEFYMISYN